MVVRLLLIISCLCWLGIAQAEDFSPKSLELNELGAQALKGKDLKRAEQMFKDAIAADRNNLTAVFNLAGVYITQKKEDVAISLLKDYTDRYDKDASLYVRMGDAYFSSRNLPGAHKSYEKAWSLDPNYSGLAGKLASIYTLYNDYPKAELYLKKVVDQNPRDAQALANLSSIFLANGKIQESIATAKLALQVKVSSDVYVTLGNAYELSGDKPNSLIAFERARDLGDKRPEITDKIKTLKSAS